MPNVVREKIWNITITYPKHTQLENCKVISKIRKYLIPELQAIEKRMLEKKINGCFYTSVRIGKGGYLIVFVDTQKANIPKLFFYNGKTNEYTTDVPYEYFQNLIQDNVMFDFEDKCRGISSEKYKTHMNKEVIKRIENDLSIEEISLER